MKYEAIEVTNTNIKSLSLSLLQCPVNRCRRVYNPIPFRFSVDNFDDNEILETILPR